jgi:hypothetical protein
MGINNPMDPPFSIDYSTRMCGVLSVTMNNLNGVVDYDKPK